ncbi:hypothetical protein I4F81_000345 [Pyropia yezoensis]|uniref:Uncharacterized protein n=1 Tax=Pyropia yezoensis TaxID=2788 RepID=A0ACC3BIJ3_PYRYE|nr:hypothetical protein I4F81_000345 [Neopyropia yezoensis]
MHAAPRAPPRLETLEVAVDATVDDLATAFDLPPAVIGDRFILSGSPVLAPVPPRVGGGHVSAVGDTAVKVGNGLYRCVRTAAPMGASTAPDVPGRIAVASYVEVAVKDTAGGSLAVGLCTAGVSMAALLGGAPGSLGLHSSGALVRPGSVSWVPYACEYGAGDVVGLIFFINGVSQGLVPEAVMATLLDEQPTGGVAGCAAPSITSTTSSPATPTPPLPVLYPAPPSHSLAVLPVYE